MLTAVLSLLTSCDEWLDVSSSTQIKSDDLFKTESGFQEALTGVYLKMASTNLYAKNLSWHFIDVLGQPYVVPSSSSNDSYNIKRYSYTGKDVKGYINSIWSEAYNTIANINNELHYIEVNKDVLDPLSLPLYKGELLALRAYLHLDLLRIFGYGNLNEREDFNSRFTIPYVTVYSKTLTEQLTYKETMDLLIKDLEDAIDNLSDDPIRGNHSADYYDVINANDFWSNRNKRMNYYAVKALLVRAYLWEGSSENVDKAFAIASELISKENTAWSWITYSSLSSTDINNVDRTFSTEHLFSLDIYDLTSKVNKYIVDPSSLSGTYTNYVMQKPLEESIYESKYYGISGTYYAPNHPEADATGKIKLSIPEGETSIAGPGINDYRANFHYNMSSLNSNNVYYLFKHYQPVSYNANFKNRIALLKITEMYYAQAEYYLRHQNENAALDVLNLVRRKRGIETDIDKKMIISVRAELTKEYMREFPGEGQLFFYYKRLNILDPTSYGVSSGYAGIENYTFNVNKFLLPYPDEEITYGNRVQ